MTFTMHNPPVRPRQLARMIARLAGAAVLALALAVGTVTIVPTLLGFQRYVISGKSMTGSLSLGDVVLAKPVPVADLEVGDVITYVPPASTGVHHLVTHRIAEITEDPRGRPVFRTKGDGNDDVDPWTFQLDQPTQVRVAHAVPKVGFVFMALAERNVRMALIGGPALAIALATLLDLWRGREGLRRPRHVTA